MEKNRSISFPTNSIESVTVFLRAAPKSTKLAAARDGRPPDTDCVPHFFPI